LFSYEEKSGSTSAFSKNSLCSLFPKIAGFAIGRSCFEKMAMIVVRKEFSAEVVGKGEGFLRLAIGLPWLFVTLTTSGLGNVSMRWFRFKGSFSVVNLIR
jgi:hypothetical protein